MRNIIMKNKKTSILEDAKDSLESPLDTGYMDFFKKGKLKITIIYEDGSYKDYFKKFNTIYRVTIKKREYFIIPECIIRGGKNPFIVFFFNNPIPINFKYTASELDGYIMAKAMRKRKPGNRRISMRVTIPSDTI